jgi:integrase
MVLSDNAIRKTATASKPVRLSDERGLYMLLNPDGSRWWRFDYRINSTRKTLSFGVYPEVSLKLARERRDEARTQIANGIDPSQKRKAAKLADENSFEAIAREWFEKFKPQWVDTHSDKIIRRLERDIFPWIGKRPIGSIKAPELLMVLRRVEARGAVETAHRAMQNCGQVFRYAISTGRADHNPAADLRGAIPPTKGRNLAAITEPSQIGPLLRAIDSYSGTHVTRSALRLAPLVFLRPGELRKGEWSEINFDTAEWRVPGSRMKMRVDHIVPLSKQALVVLRELHPWTGKGKYLFPSGRTDKRPMSDNAVLAALRRMGFPKDEMSGHGFRAMARTVLDEVLGQRVDWIEHQLAHAVKDANGRAYNRTAHLPQRHKMMQVWADYLDDLRAGEASRSNESGTAG